MLSGYLNHPLPVSVLSLCFGEGPKMLHSLWPCFLHLKRIYTAGVLTSRRKKKGTYFGCQILNVLTLSKKSTLLCYQWVREIGSRTLHKDSQSDEQGGETGSPTIACLEASRIGCLSRFSLGPLETVLFKCNLQSFRYF